MLFSYLTIAGILAAFALQPDPAVLRRSFEEALEQRRKEYGAADARTAQAARDLGLFLSRNGAAPEARLALSEAVRIDEQSFGPRAADFFRRALARQEAADGRYGVRVAIVLSALAQTVERRDGIPLLLERALAINRGALGSRHSETATTEANLAGMLLHAGRPDESVALSGGALSVFEQTLGADHSRTAMAATIPAWGLRAKGDKAGAERYYRRALAIDGKAYGPRHPQTLSDVQTLAEFLREIGKAQEAAALER